MMNVKTASYPKFSDIYVLLFATLNCKRLFTLGKLIVLSWLLVAHVGSIGAKEHRQQIIVTDSASLLSAIAKANRHGDTRIELADGHYSVSHTLIIRADNITLVSRSGKAESVIISGNGMRPSKKVDNLIRVSGKHFTLDGITLEQAGNHLVQIAGEEDADYPTLRNCILRDSYEQLFKVSYNRQTQVASDHGLIENCQFLYSAGIGPQFYIGGIDVHGGKHWVVQNNVFRDIASPSKHIAEHAIHFWNKTEFTLIEHNIIINCDRGVGFGMEGRPSLGGTISNNLIYHEDNAHPYADAGITIEESPNTTVENNTIVLLHNYPNAIEYRFKSTVNVVINNNFLNKAIRQRNGAQAKLFNNRFSTDPTKLISTARLVELGLNPKP
tara:strand:- start:11883 stop:13034 length:1152 start_codon:yes stop_codon:yes gene_type:complete